MKFDEEQIHTPIHKQKLSLSRQQGINLFVLTCHFLFIAIFMFVLLLLFLCLSVLRFTFYRNHACFFLVYFSSFTCSLSPPPPLSLSLFLRIRRLFCPLDLWNSLRIFRRQADKDNIASPQFSSTKSSHITKFSSKKIVIALNLLQELAMLRIFPWQSIIEQW